MPDVSFVVVDCDVDVLCCYISRYLVLRDWMLVSYHRSPSHYLTSTTCRTFLGADASCVFTIWWFLNEWQLINFRAKPQTR